MSTEAPGAEGPLAPATSGSASSGGTPGWAEALAEATAWVLVVLLPVHVVATVLVQDPATTTAADVLARWERPLWRVLDWLLIVLGLVHGALGTWRFAHRGAPSAVRTVAAGGVVLACGLLLAGATVAVATTSR